jgi:hypothetical protein
MDGCRIVADRFRYAPSHFHSGSERLAAHFERNAVIILCETAHWMNWQKLDCQEGMFTA